MIPIFGIIFFVVKEFSKHKLNFLISCLKNIRGRHVNSSIRRVVIILFIILIDNIAFSQKNPLDISKRSDSIPRTGNNAEKKGSYDFIVRINNGIVNRGENLNVEIYINGYGQIKNSKFNFYPSIDIIDTLRSTVTFGVDLQKLENEKVLISWGDTTVKLGTVGFMIDLGRMGKNFDNGKTDERTVFIDVHGTTTPQIMTETQQRGHAPIEYKLRIKKTASAGNHFLNFSFTYFNGEDWVVSNQQIQFTVRNIFQQYEIPLSVLVFLATILTILASISPSIKLVWDLLKYCRKRIAIVWEKVKPQKSTKKVKRKT